MQRRNLTRQDLVVALNHAGIKFPESATIPQLRVLVETIGSDANIDVNAGVANQTPPYDQSAAPIHSALPEASDDSFAFCQPATSVTSATSVSFATSVSSAASVLPSSFGQTSVLVQSSVPPAASVSSAVVIPSAASVSFTPSVSFATSVLPGSFGQTSAFVQSSVPPAASVPSAFLIPSAAVNHSINSNYCEDPLDIAIKKLQKQRELMLLQREVDILNNDGKCSSSDFMAIDSMVIKFSGDDSYDIKRWISDLEDTFALLNFGERMKLICVRRLLSGTAALFVRAVLSTSYGDLKRDLLDEFGKSFSILEIYEQLKKRKLRSNESIQHYVIEMRMIAEKANIPETDLIDVIIAGLNDKTPLVNILYQATTIQQLKVQPERYQKLRDKHNRNSLESERSVRGDKSLLKGVEPGTEVRCYNCSQFGHFQNQCPKVPVSNVENWVICIILALRDVLLLQWLRIQRKI